MENENNEVKEVVENGEIALSGDNNEIKIADDVVAVIAGVAVSEVPGVAEMAGGFAGGITEVLSGKKNLAKGENGLNYIRYKNRITEKITEYRAKEESQDGWMVGIYTADDVQVKLDPVQPSDPE